MEIARGTKKPKARAQRSVQAGAWYYFQRTYRSCVRNLDYRVSEILWKDHSLNFPEKKMIQLFLIMYSIT